VAKNSRLLELGPANLYLHLRPRASLTISNTPYPDADSDVFVQAYQGGSVAGEDSPRPGNNITVIFAADPETTDTTVTVATHAITVHLRTDPYNVVLATADEVITALTNSGQARGLVTAARGVGGSGSETVQAHGSTALSGGSEVGVATDVGYVGDAVAYQVTTEAANLTGAQTGNVPLNKVVIGGMCKVVIPFKEISLDNMRIGVPSARLIENSDKSRRRVDFTVAVGADMRSLAFKMEIRKIKGGFESAIPKDIIIIPEISPAEGEVNFPFAPTTQREILTNWYAWPDDVTGRWAYLGDEVC
jgi:hypothetical protein